MAEHYSNDEPVRQELPPSVIQFRDELNELQDEVGDLDAPMVLFPLTVQMFEAAGVESFDVIEAASCKHTQAALRTIFARDPEIQFRLNARSLRKLHLAMQSTGLEDFHLLINGALMGDPTGEIARQLIEMLNQGQ